LFAAGFSSFFTSSFLTLVSFVSGFFASGEALVFGVPFTPLTGLAAGLAAGDDAGAGVVVVGGLFSGAFAFGSQAPNIAVEAARTVAKTIDLLIVLFVFS